MDSIQQSALLELEGKYSFKLCIYKYIKDFYIDFLHNFNTNKQLTELLDVVAKIHRFKNKPEEMNGKYF